MKFEELRRQAADTNSLKSLWKWDTCLVVYSDVVFIQRFLSVSYPWGVPSCINKPNWTVQYEPHVNKNPGFCICEGKGAAQRHCFRYVDSAIWPSTS